MSNTDLVKSKFKLDIIKYRYLALGLTALFLIPGIIAIIWLMINQPNHAPLKLGIDFTGGTIVQYSTQTKVDKDGIKQLREDLSKIGVKNPIIQATTASNEANSSEIANLLSIRTTFIGDKESKDKLNQITEVVSKDTQGAELQQVNSVGPTLGTELLRNTMIALVISFILIVIYISFRFKFEYGWIALVALFQDAFFVIGIFALKGIFQDTTVDSLFITAILTVIGYSINDTIVVFDRIRENLRFLAKKHTTNEIINASVNQTLARSINTSMTTLCTLLALYFFGGSTIKDFVLAIILGVISGTCSSIFTAGTLLSIVKEKMAKKA